MFRFKNLVKFARIAIGMSGLRLDRTSDRKRFFLWAILAFGTWLLFYLTFKLQYFEFSFSMKTAAVLYALVSWVLYYVGISVILGTRARNFFIDRFGEQRAYAMYEMALGLSFLNQGLCQAALIYTHSNTIPLDLPLWICQTVGWTMMAIGFGCKTWATYLTGLDTYYYKDMMLGRSISGGASGEGYVISGPYKYFRNPMYSIGNLSAYGGAIALLSAEGLICAAIFQASIFAFFYLFELPFVKKTYLAG